MRMNRVILVRTRRGRRSRQRRSSAASDAYKGQSLVGGRGDFEMSSTRLEVAAEGKQVDAR